jgi:RNA polymerase sigma factor (sigma-70 family)
LRVAADERLVAQVRSGSQSAFEAIYDRHHAGILAFCRHMLGSREEAEDVVQHTFVAAYQGLLADDRDIALKAWLYTIARNRCLSVLRARREHVSLDDEGAPEPATAGLAAEVERREDLRALLGDLSQLPDDQRAALILAELGAHSHAEIALILEVPTVKIKALVFQAREALMSRHLGREADCATIREQLTVLRGPARRRGPLRQHIAQCEGCRAFDIEVRAQQARMAVLLPVAPTLALKHSSLNAAFALAPGGAAAAGGSGALAGGTMAATKLLGTKAIISLAVAGAGGGGYITVEHLRADRSPAAPAHKTSAMVHPKAASPAGVTQVGQNAPAAAGHQAVQTAAAQGGCSTGCAGGAPAGTSNGQAAHPATPAAGQARDRAPGGGAPAVGLNTPATPSVPGARVPDAAPVGGVTGQVPTPATPSVPHGTPNLPAPTPAVPATPPVPSGAPAFPPTPTPPVPPAPAVPPTPAVPPGLPAVPPVPPIVPPG